MPVDLSRSNDTGENIKGVSFLFRWVGEFNITRKTALNNADKEEV